MGARTEATSTVLEDVIVSRQLSRAAQLRDLDVLVIGDSSALMGLDIPRLSKRLGKRVESLALIGVVGPLGLAHMAERVAANGRIPTLVFLLHGNSLRLSGREILSEYERWALTDVRPSRGLVTEMRDVAYQVLRARLAPIPFPGSWGQAYGFAADLRAAIDAGHGSLIDPNHEAVPAAGPYLFSISSAVDERLEAAGRRLRALPVDHLLVGITPLPASLAGPHTSESRSAALVQLQKRLGGDTLATPLTLPTESFANQTHPDAIGRALFTESLARELASRQ
jgi:hypothetical protein